MQTPETTPLRKRENDSFASPEAPLLWRQPLQPATGTLHSQSTYSPSLTAASSHFAEFSFPRMRRRKGLQGHHHDNRHGAQYWVPLVFKAILASPAVVLFVWFLVLAMHHPTESSTMKSNRYGITAKKQQQQQKLQGTPHKQHGGKIPVYVPMGLSWQQQQLLSQGIQLPINGMQGIQNEQMLIPQPPAQQAFLMRATESEKEGHNVLMQQSEQMLQQPGQMMQQPRQMVQQGGQMMQMQPQMALPGQNMMQLTTQQQPGQLYQQQQLLQQPLMMQQPQLQMVQEQLQPMVQNNFQMPVQQTLQPMEQAEEQPILMAARANHKQNQQPAHPGLWGNLRGWRKPPAQGSKQSGNTKQQLPKVYYYDPAQAVVQGQLQAPSIVYDEHGNEVELASLVSKFKETDMYIEPPHSPSQINSPIYGTSQSSNRGTRRLITSSNSTNSTQPLLPLPPPPPLAMNIKRPESWGESTTQDQSIIVCTVATMALLVGALSARRLRSRSFLSSCIENESLEDEVAFDNAYTVTGGDSYNTFGWKGDLEKFDV